MVGLKTHGEIGGNAGHIDREAGLEETGTGRVALLGPQMMEMEVEGVENDDIGRERSRDERRRRRKKADRWIREAIGEESEEPHDTAR